MIGAAASDALDRIAALRRDLLHAYESGFEPLDSRIATPQARSMRSLDPLSVVAPADSYFVSADAHAAPRYSRDGSFRLVDGTLRFADGSPALGHSVSTPGSALGPLRVDPIDAAVGRVSAAGIDSDGTFAYTRTSVDPRSGTQRTERIAVGRLALARLPAGTRPVAIDATHVGIPAGTRPHLGVPGDGTFAPLTIHARDPGRLNFEAGLQRLQEAYLSFEALQSAYKTREGVEKTTLDLLK